MGAPRPNSTRQVLVYLGFLAVVGVASRWLPHPPNWTAITAVAIFAGWALRSPWLAALVPMGVMMVSDVAIGLHSGMWAVYPPFAIIAMASAGLFARGAGLGWLGTLAGATAGSLFFFVFSNLAVWWGSGMYAPTLAGLMQCFAMALPFLQNAWLGDVFFVSAVLLATKAFWYPRLSPVSR